jgi:hypothetical protein
MQAEITCALSAGAHFAINPEIRIAEMINMEI